MSVVASFATVCFYKKVLRFFIRALCLLVRIVDHHRLMGVFAYRFVSFTKIWRVRIAGDVFVVDANSTKTQTLVQLVDLFFQQTGLY